MARGNHHLAGVEPHQIKDPLLIGFRARILAAPVPAVDLGPLNGLARWIAHHAAQFRFTGQTQGDLPIEGHGNFLLISGAKAQASGYKSPASILKTGQIKTSIRGAEAILDRLARSVRENVVAGRSSSDLKPGDGIPFVIEHLPRNGLALGKDQHKATPAGFHVRCNGAPHGGRIEQTLTQAGFRRGYIAPLKGSRFQVTLPLAQSTERKFAIGTNFDLAHDRLVREAHEFGLLTQTHHGATCGRALGPGHRTLYGQALVHGQH